MLELIEGGTLEKLTGQFNLFLAQATPISGNPAGDGGSVPWDWDAVSTLAAIVAALAAVFAAIEAQRLRIEQSSPQIAIFLEQHPGAFFLADLVIRNIGQGPAHHVRFRFSEGSILHKVIAEHEVFIFQDQLQYLAPGQEMRFLLDNWNGLGDEPLVATSTYYRNESDERKDHLPIESSYKLDPRLVNGMSYTDDINRQAARALEDAMKTLKRGGITINVKNK